MRAVATKGSKGRHLIPASEFVAVFDSDGNDTGQTVPKHWGADQLPAGHSTKKPTAEKSARG